MTTPYEWLLAESSDDQLENRSAVLVGLHHTFPALIEKIGAMFVDSTIDLRSVSVTMPAENFVIHLDDASILSDILVDLGLRHSGKAATNALEELHDAVYDFFSPDDGIYEIEYDDVLTPIFMRDLVDALRQSDDSDTIEIKPGTSWLRCTRDRETGTISARLYYPAPWSHPEVVEPLSTDYSIYTWRP